MTRERIHRAVSADGTEIAGRVRGRGPSLVLVHGGIGDGEVAWEAMLPYLTDRFTCHLPSTRGRGLSGDNSDHSAPRLEEDVTAFIDSINEPAFVVGWSGGGPWVLGAAGRSGAVAAVAAYEPFVTSVMRDHDLRQTAATMEQVGMAAADRRLVDAARAFLRWICTDSEVAALEAANFYDQWAARVPAMLRFIQQDASYAGPRATDPEALAMIRAPVLLLHGRQTALSTFVADATHYVAAHVLDPHVRELPSAGHFAPVIEPEAVARELIRFFESVEHGPVGQLATASLGPPS